MSEYKYTSLSEFLKDQPPRIGLTEKDSEEIPLVTELFGELYFRERSSSSKNSSIASLNFKPPLPLPKGSSSQGGQTNQNSIDGSENGDSEDENKMTTITPHVKENGLVKNDTCMYNNSSKLFPPPISTLRMSKTGERFTYQKFDERTKAFVEEEIMLPPEGVGVMAASREDGRLRMKFAHGQEGDEGDEEEAMESLSEDEMERHLMKVRKIKPEEKMI